jgi:hypothetical protein
MKKFHAFAPSLSRGNFRTIKEQSLPDRNRLYSWHLSNASARNFGWGAQKDCSLSLELIEKALRSSDAA